MLCELGWTNVGGWCVWGVFWEMLLCMVGYWVSVQQARDTVRGGWGGGSHMVCALQEWGGGSSVLIA